MDLDKISHGSKVPDEFHVLVEVAMNSAPVKYEFDKNSNALFVDRIIQAAMHYPCNYGFIPSTLSDDGDPVDVLVLTDHPINPGAVITCRAIGVLMMEDESGIDEKILAVPIVKIDPTYKNIDNYDQLPEIIIQRITHFFEYYKKLDKNKWVKLAGWKSASEARSIIEVGVKNYSK
jgi:inorganic pyrophosphatase